MSVAVVRVVTGWGVVVSTGGGGGCQWGADLGLIKPCGVEGWYVQPLRHQHLGKKTKQKKLVEHIGTRKRYK